MKAKLLKVSLLLLVSVSFLAFRMDDDPFDALLKKFNAYAQEHPEEKVYLHLDKPYYAIGDDIWFKAYVLDNITNQPSGISNALYVELIDENDSLRNQLKLPLISGITWGDFKLADTLQEGNYRIRAYTQWMRNAGPDYFFDKTIKIGNAWANKVFTSTTYTTSKKNNKEYVDAVIKFTDKQGLPYGKQNVTYLVTLNEKTADRGKGITNEAGELSFSYENKTSALPASGKITATITLPNKQEIIKTIPLSSSSTALSIQLFPEGGNLVQDLPSKVAVKAVNNAGLGEEVSGSVNDNEGNEVFSFVTNARGMGYFVINPQSGKTYTATVKQKNGAVQNIPLPLALPAGYVLSVDNTDTTKVSAKIYTSTSLLEKGELKLVIQHNNMTLGVLKTKSAKQVSAFSLPKKDLPSGIVHLTLFDPENRPICERLVFINNNADRIDASLTGLKTSYGKRENVPLELQTKDGDKPTQGSFSIAVTNSNVVTPDVDNESNILTSLLLTSDLKGYVEKPNAYFLQNDKKTRADLDNLMLTQGWSRFLWKDIIAATTAKAPAFPAEKELKVSGTITTLGGKPVAGGKVSLMSTSGGLFMIDTVTNEKGRFTFEKLVFGDSTKFMVQARNAKNKKYVEINIDIIPGQVITKNKNTGDIEINVNEAIQSYIRKSEGYFDELTRKGLLQRTLVLDEVNIVQKKNPAKNSSNLNGAGHADFVMTAKDMGTCFNIVQCLQGRVAGLIFKNDIPYLMRSGGNTPMQIVLDGMTVEADFLTSIQPADVETIEILKSIGNTAIYGGRGAGGVLIITTKRGGGDMSYSRYSPGIITYMPKGYFSARQFYSPQYTPENTEKGKDLRSTVYWNPHLPTDSTGTGKFNFYNTDEAGIYRVVIEGINIEGHLARKVYTYEVK